MDASSIAATAANNILFDDLFSLTAVDPDGKKFDRVSRILARSQYKSMDLTLDVNVELYPMSTGDRFTLQLARSLTPDLQADAQLHQEGQFDAMRMTGGATTMASGSTKQRNIASSASKTMSTKHGSLADDFDYVMYGKVYKYEESKATCKSQALVSFGGLLMCLEGDPRHLKEVAVGNSVYLLVRRA